MDKMSRQSLTRSSSNRRGASVVELAFIAPVFFLLVFAVIEFSRAVMIQQSLTDAARAGARTAALASTDTTAKAETAARDYLRQTMTDSYDMSQAQISVSPGGLGDLATGTQVTAIVAVNFDDLTWIPSSFMQNFVLRGEASMTKE
jgi:Flp pilus assembly protein TadG